MSAPKFFTVGRLIAELNKLPARARVLICDRPFFLNGTLDVSDYEASDVECIGFSCPVGLQPVVELHPQSFAPSKPKKKKRARATS